MRLPSPLYEAVKKTMDDHVDWHLARMRMRWFRVDQRQRVVDARAKFPKLQYLDEPGSGAQFLRFHCHMIRHFKWLVDNTPGHNYKFQPWADLPSWLQDRFGKPFMDGFTQKIPGIVRSGSDDALGSFIERTRLDSTPFSGVHNSAHGFISKWEAEQYPGNQGLFDASMSDFAEAHHNELFWSLHGWIDAHFASWQAANGEPVERGPLPPHAGGSFYADLPEAAR